MTTTRPVNPSALAYAAPRYRGSRAARARAQRAIRAAAHAYPAHLR